MVEYSGRGGRKLADRKILVVDDEKKIVELVRLYLQRGGFTVITAGDGVAAMDLFRREKPDLVVLDLNLPELDGLDVCRALRKASNVPIIMLTARDEEADRLIGLELGADDYVVKPFSPRELVARVKAVLRRMGTAPEGDGVITLGDLSIDGARFEARRGDQLLDLTPTELKLLQVMAREPGRVFTRLQLLDKVQGDAFEGYERTIDAHIKNLRQKVEPNPQRPEYVLTVFGVGYKFRDRSDW
ncbi:MAG: response regulator transcription factor [Chloroflexi bacterium]|nr:response regulator transcription factor [Candidatus Methylomirabilis oxyfera]MBI4322347.1 response regulator transcription factor [Chloroflexota bacterium]